jgi:hypothetical protein
VTLYDVVAELVCSALVLHHRLEDYAAKCTRTPAKGKAMGSVKILLAGISNFYGFDNSISSGRPPLLLRTRIANQPSPAIKYAR